MFLNICINLLRYIRYYFSRKNTEYFRCSFFVISITLFLQFLNYNTNQYFNETPIQNAIVDVWHANDNGCYTVFQECQSGNSNNDPYNLRGINLYNQNGYYGFESINGYYAGRPRHFHYKITDYLV